jgi:hypothetical protein
MFWNTGGYTGDMDKNQVAGFVHGKEYVFSAKATEKLGKGNLEAIHLAAKHGDDKALSRILSQNLHKTVDDAPGYFDGGYVETRTPSTLAVRNANHMHAPRAKDGKASWNRGGDTNVTVQVQATPGTTRETAMQTGAMVGRHASISLRRNGK